MLGQTLFLLFIVRKMFISISFYPYAGKKINSLRQSVIPKILSVSPNSRMNSSCSISEGSQKTNKYTYFTSSLSQISLTMSPIGITGKKSGLEMNSWYIYPPLKDPAGTFEHENLGGLSSSQNLGICEYYISSTWYVTKYLLAHLLHTPLIPELQPFSYFETPF